MADGEHLGRCADVKVSVQGAEKCWVGGVGEAVLASLSIDALLQPIMDDSFLLEIRLPFVLRPGERTSDIARADTTHMF